MTDKKEMPKELKELLLLIEIYDPDHKPISIEALRGLMERLPLNANVRRAKWEDTGKTNVVNGSSLYKCSFCGELYSNCYKYCPNCGSYMPRII